MKSLFVEELQEVEKGLPSKGVQLVPFLEYQDRETIQLKFNLVNNGNRDIELIELWTVIPNSIQKRNWSAMPVPPALMVDEQSRGNKRLITFKYSAGVEPARTGYYRPDFIMLPRLFSLGMFPFQVKELRFVIKRDLSETDASEIIRFGVHARGVSSTGEMRLKDVEGFQP